MRWRRALCALVVMGCGGGSAALDGGLAQGDGGTDGGAAGDGSTRDGATDASVDALIPPMVPDPPDPVGAPCAGHLGFPGLPAVPTVNSPTGHALVDVSGDGKLDLVRSSGTEVVVAKGSGGGRFEPSVEVLDTTGNSAYSLSVADMNGDGAPDLVLGSGPGVKTVRVALNSGTGTFAAPVAYTSPINADVVRVADLNNDGTRDVVVFVSQSDSIAVMLNTGTALGAATTYSIGASQALAIELADLTGDGRPEVVVSTLPTGLKVLVNTGGGFAAPVSYALGTDGLGLASADLDKDGDRDVMVGIMTASNRPAIQVLANQGTGVLVAGNTVELSSTTLGAAPRSIRTADLNGDTNLDLLASNLQGGPVLIAMGTGTGQFATPRELYHANTRDTLLGDLDGDARLDLVVADFSGLFPYLNTGTPELFEPRRRVELASATALSSARVSDINGDGSLDLVALALGNNNSIPPRVVGAVATIPGTFSTALTGATVVSQGRKLVLADFNNDGQRDVFMESEVSQVVLSNSDGTFTPAATLQTPPPTALAIGDVDGDSLRDVVQYSPEVGNTSVVRVHRGLGNGNFAAPTTAWMASGSPVSIALGDLDKDGDLDIYLRHFTDQYYLIRVPNLGGGTFGASTSMPVDSVTARLAVRDIDGDGDLDLIGHDGLVQVWLGDGTGSVGAAVTTAVTTSQDLAFGDLDGDGHLDVIGGFGWQLNVLRGNGNGTFQAAQTFDGIDVMRTISIADLDGDGRLDIVTTGYGAHMPVLFGRCLQ